MTCEEFVNTGFCACEDCIASVPECNTTCSDFLIAIGGVGTVAFNNGKVVFPWWLLFLLLALTLALLWFFWPLLCPSKYQEMEEDIAPAEAVAVTPKQVNEGGQKQWKTVNASNYIWANSGGGAAPMKTQWGKLGATSSAPGAVGEEVQAAPQQEAPRANQMVAPTPSCGTRVCLAVTGCYTAAAACRPGSASSAPKPKQTQLKKAKAKKAVSSGFSELPEDNNVPAEAPVWSAIWDEQYGAYYYFNSTTDESVWVRPEGVEIQDDPSAA
jgi:hypothetical protein